MKNIALLCFFLLASACVFVASADEKTPAVDAPKMADQPGTADVIADEEQIEDDEAETENDNVDAKSDEEETETDGAQEEEEDQEDKDETTDIADDETKKRALRCRRYRKGKLWCTACGCRRPVCKSKYCTRRVCKPTKCSRKICRYVTKQRLVRSGKKTKKVPYKVRVCKPVGGFCKPKCYSRRYKCGRSCSNVCRRKCQANKS